MRAVRLTVLLVVVISCSRESPTAPPLQPSTLADVNGRVAHDETAAPVADALVEFSVDGVATVTVRTDQNGSYSATKLAAGMYGVTIVLPSGERRPAGGALLFPGPNRRDFVVRTSACVRPYGVVRDASTGRPIAGAKVELWFQSVTTGADGAWQFEFNCEGVAGSTIIFRITAPGYRSMETLSRASFLCTCAMDVALVRE